MHPRHPSREPIKPPDLDEKRGAPDQSERRAHGITYMSVNNGNAPSAQVPLVPAPNPPPVPGAPMPLMPVAMPHVVPAPMSLMPGAAAMPGATSPKAETVSPPPPLIEWVHAASLIGDPPPRQWLVPGMLLMGTVGLLYGDGGTGKSLLAMQLAVAVATSRAWLNKPVKSGGAIYYSCEDNKDEIHRRLADICRSQCITTADLGHLMLADMAGAPETLLASIGKKTGAMSPTAVFNDLDRMATGLKPALVVVDTLADVFPGNENDRAQARHFIGLMRQLARKHGCAVLLLAHPSLTGMATGTGASGSTAWNNSVRSRLYFDRVKTDGEEGDPDARRLRTMKSNYGAIGEEVAVRWQQGVFVPSHTPLASEAYARADGVFLALIRENAALGRTFTDARAHAELAGTPGANGLSKDKLRLAKERLLRAGKLHLVQEIKDRKPRTVLAVVDDRTPDHI
jgi:hypothetical protein